MIYVCPEKDCAVQKPCEPCTCGMDNLPAFKTPQSELLKAMEEAARQPIKE